MKPATTAALSAVCHAVRARLERLVSGQTVILAGSTAGSRSLEKQFRAAGAHDVRALPVPLATTGGIRGRLTEIEIWLASPAAAAALAELDRHCDAVIYAGSFTGHTTLHGRPVLGARTPSHIAAERKDLQCRFLEPRQDRHILGIDDEGQATSHLASIAAEGPHVVSGIPSGIPATGSSHTYLIDTTSPVRQVVRRLAEDCSRIVITRFDPGTPWTFYGFVSRRWSVDFGPFEALVYRNRAEHRLWAPGIIGPLPQTGSSNLSGDLLSSGSSGGCAA